ncbi:MAG: tetratricopeptide repeat protein [Parachlamydiaceae bacterium]|nr:tetratricopeptide repeat protein [Parachlamydiaceae bacterium]
MKFNLIKSLFWLLPYTYLIFSNSCYGELAPPKEIELIEIFTKLHHPVTTNNPEAQQFFDQGLTLTYAFNNDAAFKSFQKAAKLDPNMPMAYWGMALSLGSNINITVNAEKEKEAFYYILKAIQLMGLTTVNEQAYINALSKRYTDDPNFDSKKLDIQYFDAMKELVKQFPDDLDASTLYAESGLVLNPASQWTSSGDPLENTMEIVNVLESVLKRNPNHLGANHYYIHAIEGSNHPSWGLPSADRLNLIADGLGHVQHIPAHIYALVGNYEEAIQIAEKALQTDKDYAREYGTDNEYSIHAIAHHLAFLSKAYSMQGNFQNAKKSADELATFYTPFYEMMPEMEFYYSIQTFVLIRFHKWKEILLLPPPPNSKMVISKTFWLFARALAFASLGDTNRATEEQKLFLDNWKKLPKGSKYGSNSTDKIFSICDDFLNATIANKKGDLKSSIEYLREATHNEANLKRAEPPNWFFPVREILGGALLRNKQYDEAEKEFRQNLEKYPRNGRSLFGLLETLKARSRTSDAYWVEKQYQTAWKNADTELNIQDL